jgi:hypothetical protein
MELSDDDVEDDGDEADEPPPPGQRSVVEVSNVIIIKLLSSSLKKLECLSPAIINACLIFASTARAHTNGARCGLAPGLSRKC